MDKSLIGNITPTRIDGGTSGTFATSQKPVTERQSSASAWNKAGTWEERDVTEWAKDTLKGLFKDLVVNHEFVPIDEEDTNDAVACVRVKVTAVEKVDGVAQVVNVNRKVRHIYDMSMDLKWTVETDRNDSKVILAKGTTTYPDISPSQRSSDGTYDMQNKFSKRPKSSDVGVSTNALKALERRVAERLSDFVAAFASA